MESDFFENYASFNQNGFLYCFRFEYYDFRPYRLS